MSCKGCYKPLKADYCLGCRSQLFNKKKVVATLNFDAPKAETLQSFQEHSKKLSISGVQLKYSLKLTDNQLELCEKGGEYLLKPIPVARQLNELESAPENEHLTMQIAQQVFKISTAANAIIYFKDEQPAYITQRFDVLAPDKKKLQEDFAQLLSRSKQTHGDAFKYEGTYEEIGLLIKKYVAAHIPAIEKYFKLVVFNYIISNGDAHLKNFSLYSNENGEYQLTPAYDLMCTVIHSPTESDTALSLFDGDLNTAFYQQYGYYGRPDFMELAKRLGIIEKRAKNIINDLSNKTEQVIQFINRSFLSVEVKQQYLANYLDKIKRLE